MSNYITSLKGLYESYKRWVSENPQFVSDVETTAKWISYFIAGRISNSSILSELIYSLSNILVLFNDRIIQKANAITFDEDGGNRLKLMLTTLEYCEVFIEVSTKRLWGNHGRWFFIIVVQVVKSIGRFLLLHCYSVNIIRVPPIPVLDRKKLHQQALNDIVNVNDGINSAFTFKLKRSGRIMRKIEGAPPIHLRNWKPLQNELETANTNSMILKAAEGLYITKPLIHLASIGLFGYKSWSSYCTALVVDLVSIRMYHTNRHLLTKDQKLELSRRCINFLLYFVRSPFYERSSEKRIINFLNSVANNIPLTKAICHPLIQYLPHWQDTYFYMWST